MLARSRLTFYSALLLMLPTLWLLLLLLLPHVLQLPLSLHDLLLAAAAGRAAMSSVCSVTSHAIG
jgi:hypothetical protein